MNTGRNVENALEAMKVVLEEIRLYCSVSAKRWRSAVWCQQIFVFNLAPTLYVSVCLLRRTLQELSGRMMVLFTKVLISDVSAASWALLLIGLCEGDPGMVHKPSTRPLVSKVKLSGLEGHWHAWCTSNFHTVPVADWLEPSSSQTVLPGQPSHMATE